MIDDCPRLGPGSALSLLLLAAPPAQAATLCHILDSADQVEVVALALENNILGEGRILDELSARIAILRQDVAGIEDQTARRNLIGYLNSRAFAIELRRKNPADTLETQFRLPVNAAMYRRLLALRRSVGCDETAVPRRGPEPVLPELRDQAITAIHLPRPIGATAAATAEALSAIGFVGLAIYVWVRYSARQIRRARRHPCHVETFLLAGLEQVPVTVLDISQGGAKIGLDRDRDLPAAAMLHLAGHWHHARIIWANDWYAGLAFNRALGRDLLQVLIAKCPQPPGTG